MVETLLDVNGVAVAVKNEQSAIILNDFCAKFPHTKEPALITLVATTTGLNCFWTACVKTKPLKLIIDIDKFVHQQRSFPAAKQGAFNQAIGRKSQNIIDATGGWGSDALLLCSQGYRVQILERNPVMALLLRDAMQRLKETPWACEQAVKIPQVVECDAIEWFAKQTTDTHCVYFDPMFPAKKKSSAATNKKMQFLQEFVGADVDAEQVLSAALASRAPRVVVKRPHHAQPLLKEPDQRFASKLVHYDVYFNS
jgi:16S rRNA (guanine1516-N2)-methyltransferase